MQIEKKRKILEVETSVSLQTTATGCSECNMGFHKDLTREQHQKSGSHVRNLLYSNYERHKAEMLKKLEPGCQCGCLKEGEGEAEGEDHRGLVEIECKPQEDKKFKKTDILKCLIRCLKELQRCRIVFSLIKK